MERSKLMAVALASCLAAWTTTAQAGEDAWTGEAALSIAAGTGTTDTFAGNVDLKTERSWEKDLASVRFNGTYGITDTRSDNQDSVTTVDQQILLGDWKRTLSDRFFWASGAELSRDNIQDREVRAAVRTGPGYRVWRRDDEAKHHFDITGGFGYRYELYDGNQEPDDISLNGDADHLADAFAGFEYKNLLFDGKVDYTHTLRVALPVNDPNAWLAQTEAIASVPLSDAWSLRLATLIQWANDVPDGIEELSTNTTVGLGYKF